MKAGYCAIGVWTPKCGPNIGTLVRSARVLGADFVFTVGRRYKREATDCGTSSSMPVLHFEDDEAMRRAMPWNAELVAIEMSDRAKPLCEFEHPRNAVYLLGAEDHGLPEEMLKGRRVVQLPGEFSLNVAVAGSIVLYDRVARGLARRRRNEPSPTPMTHTQTGSER